MVEPYALFNGREGWYVAAWDLDAGSCGTSGWTGSSAPRRSMERFEPREGLNPIADIGGWPRTGTVGGSRVARVLDLAPSRRAGRASSGPCWPSSRTARIVVEITFKGIEFLVREVLKEAGDAVVLEPADAREAVLAAAEGLIARAT